MPFIRLALMKPIEGYEEELLQMHEDLIRYFKTLPGFMEGYTVKATDETGRIGRVTVWEHDSDADHAAMQQHTLTVRSAMLQLIEEDTAAHRELAYEAKPI
jgi:heme-degrading monooxygenase HmoA